MPVASSGIAPSGIASSILAQWRLGATCNFIREASRLELSRSYLAPAFNLNARVTACAEAEGSVSSRVRPSKVATPSAFTSA
eukprot:7376543-Prymnesium_polylepis.1